MSFPWWKDSLAAGKVVYLDENNFVEKSYLKTTLPAMDQRLNSNDLRSDESIASQTNMSGMVNRRMLCTVTLLPTLAR
jgi:hypothetical protein